MKKSEYRGIYILIFLIPASFVPFMVNADVNSPSDLYNWPTVQLTNDGEEKLFLNMVTDDSNIYFTYMRSLTNLNTSINDTAFAHSLFLYITDLDGSNGYEQMLAYNVSIAETQTKTNDGELSYYYKDEGENKAMHAVWKRAVNVNITIEGYNSTINETRYELVYAYIPDVTNVQPETTMLYNLTVAMNESIFDPFIIEGPDGKPRITYASLMYNWKESAGELSIQTFYTVVFGYFTNEISSEGFYKFDFLGNHNPYNYSDFKGKAELDLYFLRPELRFLYNNETMAIYWNYVAKYPSPAIRYTMLNTSTPVLEDIISEPIYDDNETAFVDESMEPKFLHNQTQITTVEKPSVFIGMETRIVDGEELIVTAGSNVGGIVRVSKNEKGLWIQKYIDIRNTGVHHLDSTSTEDSTGDFMYTWTLLQDPIKDYDVYVVNYAKGEWIIRRISLTTEVKHFNPEIEYINDEPIICWVKEENNGSQDIFYVTERIHSNKNSISFIEESLIILSVAAAIFLFYYGLKLFVEQIYAVDVKKREYEKSTVQEGDKDEKLNPELWEKHKQSVMENQGK
jgi:hypothetical protein